VSLYSVSCHSLDIHLPDKQPILVQARHLQSVQVISPRPYLSARSRYQNEERLTIHYRRLICELGRVSFGVGLVLKLVFHPLLLVDDLISSETGGFGSMYIVTLDDHFWSIDGHGWTQRVEGRLTYEPGTTRMSFPSTPTPFLAINIFVPMPDTLAP